MVVNINPPTEAEPMTRTRRDNTQALAEFVDRKAGIDAMLSRLQTLSDEHFNVAPEDVNWGHVTSLGEWAELLWRITDAAFHEGEHAA